MSAFDSEFSEAFAEAIDEIGEDVTIGTATIKAVVETDTTVDELAQGMNFGHKTLRITCLKSALRVEPKSEQLVVARNSNYRIAPDGVLNGRNVYKITAIARDVPQ